MTSNNSADVVVKCRYQLGNKKQLTKAWSHYVSNPKKADTLLLGNDDFNDYLSYNDTGTLLEQPKCALWNKEGNIFNDNIDYGDEDENGRIWDMVISIKDDFCNEHGLITKEDFYSLSKEIINPFLLEAGLKPDNMVWYASLHRNTKTPHLHVCFYEKHDTLESDTIPKRSIKNIKSKIRGKLIDNDYFFEQKKFLTNDIIGTLRKDNIISLKKQMLNDITIDKKLNNMLLELYNNIDKTGRLQYNSKNILPYRYELNKIIDYILKNTPYKYEYEKFYNLLKEHQSQLNSFYGINSQSNASHEYVNNEIERLRTRIGNAVLRQFKIYYQQPMLEKELNFLRSNFLKMKLTTNTNESDILKAGKRLYMLCKALGYSENTTVSIFKKWCKQSNISINLIELLNSCKNNGDLTLYDLYQVLSDVGYSKESYQTLKNKEFSKSIKANRIFIATNKYIRNALEEEERNIEYSINRELNHKQYY